MKIEDSLGYGRSELPQIKPKNVMDFAKYYDIQQDIVLLGKLKFTQGYVLENKVERKLKNLRLDQPFMPHKTFIVDRDFRILDGHHTLYAWLNYYPLTMAHVLQVDVDMPQLIAMGFEFLNKLEEDSQ